MTPRCSPRGPRPRRAFDEAGSALVEFVWLAIILMVPLIWIVLSVFEVQRGAFATSAAARAAGRAFTLAPDDASGIQRAKTAAQMVLDDQGSGDMIAEVSYECGGRADCHTGTAVVTVTIKTSVALPWMPDILGARSGHLPLDASHRLPVGHYVASDSDGGRP